MKKVLILGGDGMLGHQLLKSLENKFETKVTLRNEEDLYKKNGIFCKKNSYFKTGIWQGDINKVCYDFNPDVIINCIGIIKQVDSSKNPIKCLETNSLFPHRLTQYCETFKKKLILISTDCVFDGVKGNYSESDSPNATDLYGRTKLLGEVDYSPNVLTLRTSIIGHELKNHKSLVDWFLNQKEVRGFKNAIFSGFTTLELSKIIERIIIDFPNACGLYQVSSEKIDKFSLLTLINEIYGEDIKIIPDEEFRCDRSLNSSRFRTDFNYFPPKWETMIKEMFDENKNL